MWKNNISDRLNSDAHTGSTAVKQRRPNVFIPRASLTLLLLASTIPFATSCDSDDEKETTKGDAGDKSTPYADPVSTKSGKISGTEVEHNGQKVHVYKGIPYAQSPVGELRWKAPKPVEPWTDVRAFTEYANQCPQPSAQAMGGQGAIGDDCLHLNVVTPAKSATDKLPVMVFFHGGGLATHTSNSLVYNHPGLPSKGVVTVTVNNRLGPLGYMALPELTRESEKKVSGNYGTLDLIEALKWVKDNITAFGGDTGNVTIFGESGGGSKVLSVMSSPLAEGLYHKAIVESGSSGASETVNYPLATAEAAGTKVLEKLGVTGATDAEVLANLRAKTWEEVIAASSAVQFSPVLTTDGYVLPDSVYNIFKNGKQGKVPLIVGAQCTDLGTEVTQGVPRLAGLMSTVSQNAYVYIFTHLPPLWKQEGCSAFHGLELPYVFGAIPEGLDEPIVLYLAPGGGCSNNKPGSDATDTVVAENCTDMWSQFAKTGNPSVPGLIDWPAYTAANDTYLEIGDTLTVKTGVAAAYVPPKVVIAEPKTYSDTTYGFTITYPENWVTGATAGPKVVWRVGKGTSFIPSVRLIVRPKTEGADLKAVFTTHLTEDGAKTIKTFTPSDAKINGFDYTKAEVTYSTETLTYDSMVIGRIIGNDWYIFEVYTVPTAARFDTDTQKADILNSIKFP
jgi:para-nitrobenzyl esterase